MTAKDVFKGVLEVVPDVSRLYLVTRIIDVAVQFQIGDVHLMERIVVNLDNLISDMVDDNLPFDLGNFEGAVPVVTQTIVEQLLESPIYPKHIAKNELGVEQNVAPASFAVVGPKTGEAVTEDSSDDSSDDSPDPQYIVEATQLLVNEFRWFYLNAIDLAMALNSENYSATRKFLLDLISPFLGTDVNVASIDPAHPQYPRRLNSKLVVETNGKPITSGYHAFKLLKVARKPSPVPIAVTSAALLAELQVIRSPPGADHCPVVCACCFSDTTAETLLACMEGHIFCAPCMTDYIKVKVQDGVQKGFLECMENGCDAPFSQAVLLARLPNDMIEKLDERIAAVNLNQADLPDLVRCPKCSTAFVLDQQHKVLSCVVCSFVSCRSCGKEWNKEHQGKKCEDLESDIGTKQRRLLEEKMTAHLVRPCAKCKTPLVKNEGCNKLTCTCSATMCYVCRTPFIGYDHFCQHPRNPGQGCDKCKKCSLWIDPGAEDTAKIKQLEETANRLRAEERSARLAKLNIPSTSKAVVDLDAPGTSKMATPEKSRTPPAKRPFSAGSPMDVSPLATAKQARTNMIETRQSSKKPPSLHSFNMLIEAIDNGDIRIMRNLIDAHGQKLFNMHTKNGSIVHYAAQHGNVAALKLLLQRGAAVSLRDKRGNAPIHRAILHKRLESALLLLKNGERLEVAGEDDRTPIHCAVIARDSAILRQLLKMGANVNQVDRREWTPLHYAVRNYSEGKTSIVDLLLLGGANLNAQNNEGNSALHLACTLGLVSLSQLLIRRGGDVNLQNKVGKTPLHLSAKCGVPMREVSSVLLKTGANTSLTDLKGTSPAGVAQKHDPELLLQFPKMKTTRRGGKV